MNVLMPRFQGKATETPEGWYWEMHVSALGEPEGDLYKSNEFFKTKDACVAHLKKVIQDVIKDMADTYPEVGINPETYIDLQENATRKWREN